EAASKALDAIGTPALQALRDAIKSSDAEVRKRAGDLAGKIEKRAESERVLKAKMVHLVFKDTPLKDAVEDFKKQSGYAIVLHDPSNKLKDKKITLDTGKTTFWDALEKFCAAAGVSEGDPNANAAFPPAGAGPLRVAPRAVPAPAPAPGRGPGRTGANNRGARNPGGRGGGWGPAPQKPVPPPPAALPAAGPGAHPAGDWTPVQAGQITLMPGKPEAVPADNSSSIRVRLADRKRHNFNVGAKEIGLVLEISPEPRLRWQQTMSVLIDKAVDDNSQTLRQAGATIDIN